MLADCTEATQPAVFNRCRGSLTGISPALARKSRKFPRHGLVNLTPERHDQRGDIRERLPAPGVELRLLIVAPGRHGDLALVAGEAKCEPLLPLAAEFRQPGRRSAVGRSAVGREVVGEPVRGLAEIRNRGDAGLLVKLALGSR